MKCRRNAKQCTEQKEHDEQFVGAQYVKTISREFQIKKKTGNYYEQKKRTNTERQNEEQ